MAVGDDNVHRQFAMTTKGRRIIASVEEIA
jgi:predicted transcriptional regulator